VQFIRHPLSLDFTIEPDIVHEFVGHVPMLANPVIAVLLIIWRKFLKR
jgi:phenylalanine-4-hydroxylase